MNNNCSACVRQLNETLKMAATTQTQREQLIDVTFQPIDAHGGNVRQLIDYYETILTHIQSKHCCHCKKQQ
jgi:hypothetical protein